MAQLELLNKMARTVDSLWDAAIDGKAGAVDMLSKAEDKYEIICLLSDRGIGINEQNVLDFIESAEEFLDKE